MNEEIKIEHGVPMPKGRHGSVTWKSLLEQMDVGDSFALSDLAQVNSVMPIANRVCMPKQFTRRHLPDGTYRIWRIK